MPRIKYKAGIFLVVFILFVSCGKNSNKAWNDTGNISVVDFRGKKISFKERPKRVVCLVESALTGIYMLKSQEFIQGIPSDIYKKSFFKYYSKLDARIRDKKIPSPGNWDFVNLEQLVSIRPDLVIIWSSQKESIERIEKLNIPVYSIFLDDFNDIYKEIRDFGFLFNKKSRADSLIYITKDRIKFYKNHANKDKLSGAYFMWTQGLLETSGKHSTVSELLEYAGLRNVCDMKEEHVNVNIEKLYEWNPEIIVMWHNERIDPVDVISNKQFSGIAAVKNKKVFELPEIFQCDFWTLKFVYPVYLMHNWNSGTELNKTQDSLILNDMFHDLYDKNLL